MNIKLQWQLIEKLSILFLLVPIIIFFLFWVRIEITISFLLVISYYLFKLFVQKNKLIDNQKPLFIPVPRSFNKVRDHKSLILILIIIIIWVLLSGAGHRGEFDGDYFKHNGILNDLIKYNWPVNFKIKEITQPIYLTYYIAYYLPAALLGKFTGWTIANIFLFFWTLIGTIFSFLWFYKSTNKKISVGMILFFIFISGLDIIPSQFFHYSFPLELDMIEWWNTIWQYSGNTTLIFFVPQHCLAGWIAIGIIVDKIKSKNYQNIILVSSLTILWSPFVSLGLMLFILYILIKDKFKLIHNLKELFPGFIITLITGIYLLSNINLYFHFDKNSGFIWQLYKPGFFIPLLISFYFLELIVFLICIRLLKNREKIDNTIKISLIILLLLPFYKFGYFNDLVMRSSIPALFIFFSWVYQNINLKQIKNDIAQFILILVLLIAGLTPALQLYYSSVHWSNISVNYSIINNMSRIKYLSQYLGKSDTVWGKHIARQSKPFVIKKTAFSKKESIKLNNYLNNFSPTPVKSFIKSYK